MNKKEKRFIIIWSLALIGCFTFFTIAASNKLRLDKQVAEKNHEDRLNAYKQEGDLTWINPKDLIEDKNNPAVKVAVGIYLDHIVELSTKNTDWTVDFYIWFRWKGEELHPGKDFHVISGEILSRELIDSAVFNKEKYELYHVSAKITKFFNVTRYPRDDHMLTISIENKYYAWHKMQYIPDVECSTISSRGKLPGYSIADTTILVSKAHLYKTTRGDPRLENKKGAVYDRLIFGIQITRPDWGLFYKMFLLLFTAVAVAFLVFLIKVDGDRIGLGVGALFSAVASSYISTSELPGVGILTLCDILNVLGIFTIFLTIMSSVIIKHIAFKKGNYEFAKRINIISFAIFLLGYVISNIMIAQAASL